MPTYELIFVVKKMTNSALKVLLSRTAKYVLESGAILRKIENLGVRTPPHHLSRTLSEAQYYLYEYEAGEQMGLDITDKFRRDVEVMKATYMEKYQEPGGPLRPKKKIECNVFEDDLPPPERPNVKKLMETSKNLKNKSSSRKPFNYGTGGGMNPL